MVDTHYICILHFVPQSESLNVAYRGILSHINESSVRLWGLQLELASRICLAHLLSDSRFFRDYFCLERPLHLHGLFWNLLLAIIIMRNCNYLRNDDWVFDPKYVQFGKIQSGLTFFGSFMWLPSKCSIQTSLRLFPLIWTVIVAKSWFSINETFRG